MTGLDDDLEVEDDGPEDGRSRRVEEVVVDVIRVGRMRILDAPAH